MEEQFENQSVSEETVPQKKRKSTFIKIARELLIYALILVLGLVVIPKYVFARNVVKGESMENTLNDKDWLIRERVTYYFGEPDRFDLIIFTSPVTGEEWVKRVIALPGETIQIKDGTVWIDGEKLTEDVYGNALIDISGVANEPYTVPEGCYFVMGDNRKNEESWDSRYEEVGCIPKENILGKVVLRIYPFDSFSTF